MPTDHAPDPAFNDDPRCDAVACPACRGVEPRCRVLQLEADMQHQPNYPGQDTPVMQISWVDEHPEWSVALRVQIRENTPRGQALDMLLAVTALLEEGWRALHITADPRDECDGCIYSGEPR